MGGNCKERQFCEALLLLYSNSILQIQVNDLHTSITYFPVSFKLAIMMVRQLMKTYQAPCPNVYQSGTQW
jgi:hypothetical protein